MRYIGLLLCFICVPAMAQSFSRFYTSFELGLGRLNVEEDASFDDVDRDSYSTELGLTAGAYISPRVPLEFSLVGSHGNSFLGAFDSFFLQQRQFLIGYRFGDKNTFTPKVGWAFWSLKGVEGALFNPGPEEESDFDGSDIVYAIEYEKTSIRRFSWGVKANYIDTDLTENFSMRFFLKLKVN